MNETELRLHGLETRMVVLSRQVESLKDKPMDELKLREIIGAEIKFQLSKIGRRIPLQGAIMTSEELRELLDLPPPSNKEEFLNFLDSLKEQIEEDDDEEDEEEEEDDGCYDCQHTPTSKELAVYKRVKDYLEC